MADVKIQDVNLIATPAGTNKMPVSDGTSTAKTISVDQIIGVHEAKTDPHTQYVETSELGTAAYEDTTAFDAAGTASSLVSALSNVYEPKNANIQQHIASTSDPHNTQFDQLGGTLTKLPFNTSLAAQTLAAGEMAWNPDERTFDMGINGVTLQAGQEIVVHVRNSTASTIQNGTVCMATGTIGASGRITVAPMVGSNANNAMYLLGIATEDILAGADGFVTVFGKVRGVDTSAYVDGDVLYTSTTVAGGLTKTAPTSVLKQPIAFVVNAHSNGVLFVRIETLNHLAFQANGVIVTNGDGSQYLANDGTYKTVSSGTTDHGSLSGLSDDDHSQYLDETRHDLLDHTGLTGVPSMAGLLDETAHDLLDHTGLIGIPTAYTDEMAQDAVGAAIAAGTQSGITVTYDDANNKINFTVTASGAGDVTGPASATDGNLVLFDGVTGKVIKNSTYSPASFAAALGADDNYVTDEEKAKIGNLPTNTTAALAGKDNFHGIESCGAMSFDNSTHVFSMASTKYWYLGTVFESATPITCDLDSFVTLTANTTYFVYFNDATGTLVASASAWNMHIHVPVALILWNGSVGAIGYECHNHTRDIDWHNNAHQTIGTRYQSGLVQTLPSTTTDNQINIGSGTIWDEDIQLNISAQTQARLWYKTASGYTFNDTPTSLPYAWNSGTSRVQYLDIDTNALTDLGASQFTVVWVYATSDITYPIYLLVGEHASPYTTLANARAATPPNLASSPFNPESKLIYRWIFNGSGDYQEAADYRQSSTLPAGGTAATSAASVTFTPSGNISATTVQSAIEELDSEKAPVANGVTNGDSHDHSGGDGAQISYNSLSDLPSIPSISGLLDETAHDQLDHTGLTGVLSATNPAITGPATITADSTSAALTVTQTGTGNALVIEDSASLDASPFVIAGDGRVCIGRSIIPSASASLQIATEGSSPTGSAINIYRNDPVGTPAVNFLKSRGDGTTPTSVIAGEIVMSVGAFGHDGTTHSQAAQITAAIDGTPSTNNMPGRLIFSTTAAGSATPTEAMRIDNAGNVGIGGGIALSYAGLYLGKNITGASAAFGIYSGQTVDSASASASARYFHTAAASTAGTTTALYHYSAAQGTFAGTVSTQFGFQAAASLIGATNNYGFYSAIPSGTGRWNFYAAGTAANYFAGITTFANTTDASTKDTGAVVIDGGLGVEKTVWASGYGAGISAKTTAYTATTTDHTLLVTGNTTVTLPAAASNNGRIYVIKKTDTAGTTVTVDGNASETIDGSTTVTLTAQYQSITIQCDGSNWHII